MAYWAVYRLSDKALVTTSKVDPRASLGAGFAAKDVGRAQRVGETWDAGQLAWAPGAVDVPLADARALAVKDPATWTTADIATALRAFVSTL